MEPKWFLDWAFGHYLNIAHPQFVGARVAAPAQPRAALSAA
jgi:hypothetical protein